MNSMPYGVVQKMMEDGWVPKKDDGFHRSGRILLTHPNHSDWSWVDNGITNNKRWIFLKLSYGDLSLDETWWPIKVVYTEKKVRVEPKNNRYHQEFSYEDFEYIKKVMGYYHIKVIYEDTRPEYYKGLIESKKKKIERTQREIAELKKEIASIKKEIQKIEEKTDE